MKLPEFLWAVAAAVIVVWLLSYASISYQNASHNQTIYHYKTLGVCPGTPVGVR